MSTQLENYTKKFNDLKTIFDSLPDGIIGLLDQNMSIATANKAFADMFDIPMNNVVGKKAKEIFKEKFPSLTEVLTETYLNKKGIINYTTEYIKSDNDRRTYLVSTVILEEKGKNEFGIVLILHDITEVTRLRKMIKKMDRYEDLIGASDKMKDIFSYIELIKDYDTSLLLVGETGTGKELVATAVHNCSKRKNKPFIPVNCSAIPADLMESELFGHVKGAFTGAISNHRGRFEIANEGTLFLDEIGTLSLSAQAKLLRVLQDKIVEPLGSSKRLKINARIISATNRNLKELVDNGVFREDLYYRIKVLQINIPPLRERVEDIPILVDHLISRLNGIYNKKVIGIVPEMKEILTNYPWPGNVRELENTIEHAYVSADGIILKTQHLPAEIRFSEKQGIFPAPSLLNLNNEEETIKRALISVKGNVTKAAELMEMHRTTLWRKMREFRIEKNFGKNMPKDTSSEQQTHSEKI
jgi:PAS domain S-box-containing protein